MTVGITILVTVGVAFLTTVIVLEFVWPRTITDLFPGGVAQDLTKADLTWVPALKAAALVAALTGVNRKLTDPFNRR